MFFVFSGFLSARSPRSDDPNHKSKRLAQVDFGHFLKHFLKIFFLFVFFFCYSIYGVIPISCSRSYVWFIHPGWLSSSLKDFFICFHHIGKCPFFIFFWCVQPFIIYFMVWIYSIIFVCNYCLSHEFFRMDLSFIYLNKEV